MPGVTISADNKGGKSSPHIGVRIFASQKQGGFEMHKELEGTE